MSAFDKDPSYSLPGISEAELSYVRNQQPDWKRVESGLTLSVHHTGEPKQP